MGSPTKNSFLLLRSAWTGNDVVGVLGGIEESSSFNNGTRRFFFSCESIDLPDYVLKSQNDKGRIKLVFIIQAIPMMLAQDHGRKEVVK